MKIVQCDAPTKGFVKEIKAQAFRVLGSFEFVNKSTGETQHGVNIHLEDDKCDVILMGGAVSAAALTYKQFVKDHGNNKLEIAEDKCLIAVEKSLVKFIAKN